MQFVDTPQVSPGHVEPWLAILAHGADGLLLVLDVAADDADVSARSLAELLDRARVWPRARPLPLGASPLTAHKAVVVASAPRRFDGQQVDRHDVLMDGDVVELHS